MVKLRLKRIGRRKSPFYRLVAIDSRKRRDGREIEKLGWYNPLKPGLEAQLNENRVLYWLKEGAVPSATVYNLLTKKGINFKIHLNKLGKTEDEISSLMEEWYVKQQQKLERAEEKKIERKLAKKDSSKSKVIEEAPAEEAPAEEAPAEEAPAEEAPAEE
ncbi:MAG: 30S ribosomal protein S16, partial [Candidatus Marinimicrobia bacterium]|nr:30S ribosomal protein S16 [Candidatus Neomarinimicrobiota bacterium]